MGPVHRLELELAGLIAAEASYWDKSQIFGA